MEWIEEEVVRFAQHHLMRAFYSLWFLGLYIAAVDLLTALRGRQAVWPLADAAPASVGWWVPLSILLLLALHLFWKSEKQLLSVSVVWLFAALLPWVFRYLS